MAPLASDRLVAVLSAASWALEPWMAPKSVTEKRWDAVGVKPRTISPLFDDEATLPSAPWACAAFSLSWLWLTATPPVNVFVPLSVVTPPPWRPIPLPSTMMPRPAFDSEMLPEIVRPPAA